MIVKVCGMREADNIREVEQLGVTMMGFIFYDRSSRFVSTKPSYMPTKVKHVGVFVNSSIEFIKEHVVSYQLDYVQLHGHETAAFCKEVKQLCNVGIIKAFGISENTDWKEMKDYEEVCDYFLFDTACSSYGGSGRSFDWQMLAHYNLHTPFLLSGGIDSQKILELVLPLHPRFAGIDLNSKFEEKPGLKSTERLRLFLRDLNTIKKTNTKTMNRINELIEKKNKKLLSLYFCAGYPTLDGTAEVLKSMQDAGVDFAEIGIPFSDPMADGPVIQNASAKALRNGMSLKLLFSQLRNIREIVSIPLVLMGYLNPIFQYGFENFCRSCKECGVDGAIIPDLPFSDYIATYKPIAEKYGVHLIMLITPETSEERVKEIDRQTNGFIYMVSTASTTGAQVSFEEQQPYFDRIESMNLKNPRMIGFGISNKATLEAALRNAEGAIIGSKFVHLQGCSSTSKEAIDTLLETLKQ